MSAVNVCAEVDSLQREAEEDEAKAIKLWGFVGDLVYSIKPARALSAYSKVLRIKPDDVETLAFAVALAGKLGELEQAKTLLAQSFEWASKNGLPEKAVQIQQIDETFTLAYSESLSPFIS